MIQRARACTCPQCCGPEGLELDLLFPGEGRQLAFSLPNRRATRQPRASQKELSA